MSRELETHTTLILDFGFCCRIYPILELEEPSMLSPSNSSDDKWLLPEYSEALSSFNILFCQFCLFHVSWSDKCLFQGTRNSGQHMNQDEVPKTELEMACCSWWMRRHSRVPIILGKNIGGKWSYISRSVLFCVTLSSGKQMVWLLPSEWHFCRTWIGKPHHFRGVNHSTSMQKRYLRWM